MTEFIDIQDIEIQELTAEEKAKLDPETIADIEHVRKKLPMLKKSAVEFEKICMEQKSPPDFYDDELILFGTDSNRKMCKTSL